MSRVKETCRTTKLQRLYQEHGQSPWLDNLKHNCLSSGELQRMIVAGIRGITANPTIVTNAILESSDYNEQYEAAIRSGRSVGDAYWELVLSDARRALDILRPLYDNGHGADGVVSVEVDPGLAANTIGTIGAVRQLHQRLGEPNLLVKIPATPQRIPAIRRLVAEGRNVNVTLTYTQSSWQPGRVLACEPSR